MKPEDRYHRFVLWSDEGQCYIGYCPDLCFGGVCHGAQEETPLFPCNLLSPALP